MENIFCQFCHQLCDEHVFLQCNHSICSKCAQSQFSFELLRAPCDHFQLNIEHKQKEGNQQIHDEKKIINICCPKCNEKTISIFSQGDIKLAHNQQLSVINDGLGENQQQQQHIPDEMLQWMFQFLNAKELFTKIRFTCNRMDKIVCTLLLSLHCQGLHINGLKLVCEILPKETQLQELNLMLNNIGDNEVTEIATIFPLIKQLQILDLSWNQIGDIGATAIANSISNLTQLQVLDMCFNSIGKTGITAISNATKEFTKLQQLEICEKYSKTILERVQQVFNEKGIKLNLKNCNIDDACAIAVAKVLPHLTQLQMLYFHHNQIGITGTTAIAYSIKILTQLQGLYLFNNQIGDTGAITIASSISNFTQLQHLYLNNNLISDTGAIAIANAITNMTQLQHLFLGSNQIGDTGAIVIANSISNWTRLNCLSLWNNNISEPAKQQLREQFGDKLAI